MFAHDFRNFSLKKRKVIVLYVTKCSITSPEFEKAYLLEKKEQKLF
jgi:hypothetical protein